MATYNNKHWLLSHIRNSFISTDETGMCEAVMLSEDLPNQYVLSHRSAQIQKPPSAAASQQQHQKSSSSSSALARSQGSVKSIDIEDCCYPGLDQSDEEDVMDPLSQSYDIQIDQGISFIQRSNTAQKLDKMNMARKRAAKIKTVKCEDSVLVLSDTEAQQLFVRKTIQVLNDDDHDGVGDVGSGNDEKIKLPKRNKHLLSDQLTKYPKPPLNKYLKYSRFDGTAQMSISTKTIRIFLTILPEAQRNYPMTVCVSANAKIKEFIGLICYKTSLAYPEIQLLAVGNYGLYITEEDGDIDMDFPPLDLGEPCSKFCFNHLALVERKASDIRNDTRTMSMTSEIETVQELLLQERNVARTQEFEDLARMLGHTRMMEAPLYRSYRLQIQTKGLFKTDIQLGISAEKLEIDPVQQHNNKFWGHQKAISHSMDQIVWCDIDSQPSATKTLFHIVYCHFRLMHHQYSSQQDQTASPLAHSISAAIRNDLLDGNVGGSSGGSGGIGGNRASDNNLSNQSTFRNYNFITDPATAHEIVDKIRNIIEVRSSSARREYLSKYAQSTTILPNNRILLTPNSGDKKRKNFKRFTFI